MRITFLIASFMTYVVVMGGTSMAQTSQTYSTLMNSFLSVIYTVSSVYSCELIDESTTKAAIKNVIASITDLQQKEESPLSNDEVTKLVGRAVSAGQADSMQCQHFREHPDIAEIFKELSVQTARPRAR